jgi:hypothetical protein
MSKRIKENSHALNVIRTATPKLRKAILSACNNDLINSISECCLNVLKGNVTLTPCLKSKLKEHKMALRQVADRHVKQANKKRLILQKAGFLLPLLTAMLPTLVTSLFPLRPG